MSFNLAEAIVYFKGDDKQLNADLDSSEKKTESAAASMAKAFGGAIVAGAAVAGSAILAIGGKAFDVASQIDAATDQIGASLGLGADEAKAYGDAIKAVYGDNFGASIEDVGKSVEIVAKQLKLAGNDPSLKKITENAYRLQDVFGTDVADSISTVKTLMDNFGVSSEEAFDLLTKGYQVGLDRSGDFLDTVNEYSTQFANGGASAREFFSIIETGAQGGVLGTDKAADAFKEFRVRIQDGSDLTKTSLEMIGINADDMAAKFADGSITAMDAFNQVTGALNQLDDENVRMVAGVGLLGTQFEDLGQTGVTNIDSMSDSFAGVEGATASLDTKYTSLGSTIEGMWRQFQVGIAPAGEALLGLANENLPAIQGAINTASGLIVTAVGLIPIAISAARTAWDEDWAGIRTTWEQFAADLPAEQARFWSEWNKTFSDGSTENQRNWEGFFSGVFGFMTGWWRLVIANWTLSLGLIRGEWQMWSSLFKGDWEGVWEGFKLALFSVTDIILNYIEFIFGPGFRDALAGALNSIWTTLGSWWETLKGWWNSTIGLIPGMDALSSTPNLGIVNPVNVPNLTVPSLIPGGLQPQVQAQSLGNVVVNQTFYGQVDTFGVKTASEDGVLRAGRTMGLR